MRNDVGFELRTLLNEELASAAEAAGRKPDEEMTIELLRGFGRPEDVADRYRPAGFNVIEPEHAAVFVKLSLTFIGIQWALTLAGVFSPLPGETIGDALLPGETTGNAGGSVGASAHSGGRVSSLRILSAEVVLPERPILPGDVRRFRQRHSNR